MYKLVNLIEKIKALVTGRVDKDIASLLTPTLTRVSGITTTSASRATEDEKKNKRGQSWGKQRKTPLNLTMFNNNRKKIKKMKSMKWKVTKRYKDWQEKRAKQLK